MLVGKKCKVGNQTTNRDGKAFNFFEGVIASEPQMYVEIDFYVVVQVEGELKIVDTDYIYDLDA